MSPEEKPPEDSDSHSVSFGESNELALPNSAQAHSHEEPVEATAVESSTIDDSSKISNPIVAELADSDDSSGDLLTNGNEAAIQSTLDTSIPAPPMAGNLENMSANGGAVGSFVLGIWCVLGSFITTWSIINGVLGLLMGFWGLTSRKQRLAWIGIALCVVGIFLSLVQVSELINLYLNAVDETPY